MAFCSNCGARIPDNARFCEECGTPVAAPSGRRVEKKADDYFDNIEEVNEIFASDEEGEMSLGSWEEEAPAARHQPRRTPRYEEEVEENYDEKPSKKEPKSSFLKILKTSVLAIGVPIFLVLGGIWVYGLIKGNDGNGGSDNVKYRPNQLPDPSGTNEPELFDMEADDSSFKSEEEMKEYEKEVLSGIRKEYEDKYTGTWQSVGMEIYEFSQVEDLMNKDVAALIDRTMIPTDGITFVFGNGKARLCLKEKIQLYGDYNVRDSGNISVNENGTTHMIWMYAPNENTLYSYYYIPDSNGGAKANACKFKRISTKPNF